MAVAFRTSAESQRTDTSDPHTFNFTVDAADKGLAVLIGHGNANTDLVSAVTIGGVSLGRVDTQTDNLTEPGRVYLYFVGTGLPSAGSQTVSIDLTSGTTTDIEVVVAALTGSADLEVVDFDGTTNLNQDDPTLTLNYGGRTCITLGILYSGVATVLTGATPNANMTLMQEFDIAAFGVRADRQTTPGSSDFTFSYTTAAADDVAISAMAISEVITNASGTGAVTTAATTVSGTGTHATPVTGTGAVTTAATTTSGTGVETFTATGAVTTAAATVEGTGAEVFTATGAPSLAAVTVSGTGAEVFTATGAATLAATTTDGTGDHTAPQVNPEGSGAVTLAASTVEGTGSLGLTGTGAAALAAMTASGTGVLVLTGTGAIALGVVGVSGTGAHIENASGTGAVSLGAATVAGSGLHVENVTGTGAVALPALTVSGTGDGPSGGRGGGRGTPVVISNDDDDVFLLYPFEDLY